jgi:hypothetical protein
MMLEVIQLVKLGRAMDAWIFSEFSVDILDVIFQVFTSSECFLTKVAIKGFDLEMDRPLVSANMAFLRKCFGADRAKMSFFF